MIIQDRVAVKGIFKEVCSLFPYKILGKPQIPVTILITSSIRKYKLSQQQLDLFAQKRSFTKIKIKGRHIHITVHHYQSLHAPKSNIIYLLHKMISVT